MIRVCSFVATAVLLLAGVVSAQTPAPRSEVSAKSGPVVNLNTATLEELQSLPGIGPKVAARIIDHRTKKGPFRKVEELMNVQGIGEKSFLKLRAQLTVTGKAEAPSQP